MNCTNLITCMATANQAFPYWNVIASSVLAILLTFSITLCVAYIGPTIGGIFSSVPTSITMSMLGIAVNNVDKVNTNNILNTTHTVPIGLCITSCVFLIFAPLNRACMKRLKIQGPWLERTTIAISALTISIAWVICMSAISGFIYVIALDVYSTVVLGWSFETITLIIGLSIPFRSVEEVPTSTTKKKRSITGLIIRSILAGAMVAVCVIVGKQNVPVITGVIASFPSIKLVVLLSVALREGVISANRLSNDMILGNGSAGIFTMIFGYCMLYLNMFVSLFVAYVTCVIVTVIPLFMYKNYIQRKRSCPLSTTQLSEMDPNKKELTSV